MLFLKAGLFTTVQDQGRNGYQKSGFSVCGVMDRRAFLLANLLLDNPENEAMLEFTVVGPTIQFTADAMIAITGGDFSPVLNDQPVPTYTALFVHENDVLKMGVSKTGNWGYLAVAGGFDIPVVMGSRSTDPRAKVGGFHGRRLKNGDQIWLREGKTYLSTFLSRSLPPENFSAEAETIRVIFGPQEDYFSGEGIQTFLSSEYALTKNCDRMGYRLEGEAISHQNGSADIISDGIAMGAIQVPSQGKPIVMMADRQTTGGYTKIANVISVDLPRLVQQKEGHTLRFSAVTVEEAQRLYREEQQEFEALREQIHRPCKEKLNPRSTARRVALLF
jgi:biotin-dependent carboxylase-like uncharacterized protein